MPQPIQGPTLADVGANLRRREKEITAAGKISATGKKELARIAENARRMTGATKKEQARQRAIAKEMKKMQGNLTRTGNIRNVRKYNALFRESDRIARRARARAEALDARAAKKAAKAKKAKKAAKKAPAKKAKKKAAKKAPAKKAARPVKKAAKKSR